MYKTPGKGESRYLKSKYGKRLQDLVKKKAIGAGGRVTKLTTKADELRMDSITPEVQELIDDNLFELLPDDEVLEEEDNSNEMHLLNDFKILLTRISNLESRMEVLENEIGNKKRG